MAIKHTFASLISDIARCDAGPYEHAAMAAIVSTEHGLDEDEISPAQAQLLKVGYECDDAATSLHRVSVEGVERMTAFARSLLESHGADRLPTDPTTSSAFLRVSELVAALKGLRRTYLLVAEIALPRPQLVRLGDFVRKSSAVRSDS